MKNKDMKTFLLRRAAGAEPTWSVPLHKQLQLKLRERATPAREFNHAAHDYLYKNYGYGAGLPGWVSREAVARAAAKAMRPRNVLGKELPSLCC
jgi:hypothetical protein